METRKVHVEFVIVNQSELQDTFAAFFRTMGCQMGSVEKPGRRGAVTLSSSLMDKFGEACVQSKGFFDVNFRAGGFREIDLDNEVVTVPIRGKVAKGLLEAIDHFEDEDNRVIHPTRRRALEAE